MPTLELEKLGVVDLSNEKDALTQVVGGRRSAAATLVSYNNPYSGYTEPARIAETQDIANSPVSVTRELGNREGLGLLKKQSNGKWFGTGSYGRIRAEQLFFDNLDRIQWDGIA